MRLRRLLPAAVLLLALTACSNNSSDDGDPTPSPSTSTPAEPSTTSATGTVSVPVDPRLLPQAPAEGDRCLADNAHQDIAAGARLTVADDTGQTLGTAALQDGKLAAGDTGTLSDARCEFAFTATVPAGRNTYVVRVGLPDRGEVRYTESQLDSIELELG